METGDAGVLNEIVHKDFVNHTAAGSFAKDVSGLVQFVKMLHAGFSNFKIDIHDQIGEGDLVTTRKTITATHTGEIMGHAATGKEVAFNVIDIVRIKDGKYIDHWGRNDVMQVIQGL
jgi:predicted ester cyclase